MRFLNYEDIELDDDIELQKIILEVGPICVEMTLEEASRLKERIRKKIVYVMSDGALEDDEE